MILSKTSIPVGIQLYTVTTELEEDRDGTLKKIAEIGYTEAESASSNYYGLKPKEFADILKSFGLNWRAHHITGAQWQPDKPIKNLRDNYQEVVNDIAEGGVKYLVCSSIPVGKMEDIKQSIDTLNKTGEACKKAGVGFAFHNHTWEFNKVDGQLPYDMFLSQISADLMKMELDLAWAVKAGVDPVELFKKYPGRFPLWHVKDLEKASQKPVEVGTGMVDFKKIFNSADTAGLEYYFIEQDQAPRPLENIAASYTNLKSIID